MDQSMKEEVVSIDGRLMTNREIREEEGEASIGDVIRIMIEQGMWVNDGIWVNEIVDWLKNEAEWAEFDFFIEGIDEDDDDWFFTLIDQFTIEAATSAIEQMVRDSICFYMEDDPENCKLDLGRRLVPIEMCCEKCKSGSKRVSQYVEILTKDGWMGTERVCLGCDHRWIPDFDMIAKAKEENDVVHKRTDERSG